MNRIHNPFSRDEHPDLTAAILGVVNEAKAKPISAVLKAAKRSVLADRGGLKTPKARAAKAEYKAAVKAAQAVDEAASPQGGGKKPFNPFNPTLGDLLHSKAQDKPAPKPKPVKEAVTPAQQKVFARERERMLSALNNPKQKLSPTEREAVLARGARNAAAETRKSAVSPTGVKLPIHAAAKAHHEYARRESKKLDAIAKRKVQEAAQLDERIIDEVDFFQASKNWITGKGFKTNREAAYDRVEKNYAAMKKREAAAAKAKKTK